MYLPKGKYSKPKYSYGGDLSMLDGTSYKGYYFTDQAGNTFTGSKPSSDSKLLIRTSEELVTESTKTTAFKRFVSQTISPTEKDYENGFFTRYFLQDKRSEKIIEVKLKKYKYWQKYYFIEGLKLTWLLTTPIKNIKKGPYVFFGSESKNKETVLDQKIIRFPENYFVSYSEFIREEEDSISENKFKKIQEDLFTPGKEFTIRGTNQEYVGKYHIHPEKGPMVGAKHTSVPHNYLDKIVIEEEQTTQIEQEVTGSQEPTIPVNVFGGSSAPSSGGGGGGGYSPGY